MQCGLSPATHTGSCTCNSTRRGKLVLLTMKDHQSTSCVLIQFGENAIAGCCCLRHHHCNESPYWPNIRIKPPLFVLQLMQCLAGTGEFPWRNSAASSSKTALHQLVTYNTDRQTPCPTGPPNYPTWYLSLRAPSDGILRRLVCSPPPPHPTPSCARRHALYYSGPMPTIHLQQVTTTA
jgi:hypothetical protein